LDDGFFMFYFVVKEVFENNMNNRNRMKRIKRTFKTDLLRWLIYIPFHFKADLYNPQIEYGIFFNRILSSQILNQYVSIQHQTLEFQKIWID